VTISSGSPEWTKAYLVLLAYAALCAAIVTFAPNHYLPHLSTSHAFSAVSDFPSTTAFCIEMLWGLFPLAFLAFSLTAPIKLTTTQPHSDLAMLCLFVGLGFFVVPLVIDAGLFTTRISSSLLHKTTRSIFFASHNKLGLTLAAAVYFCGLLVTAWLPYVAIPRAYVALKHRARV
jgi:hypothetical protein